MRRAMPGAAVMPELTVRAQEGLKPFGLFSSRVEFSRAGICEWINLIRWAVVRKYLLNERMAGRV